MGRYPRRANFSLVCQDGLEVPLNKEVLIIFGKDKSGRPTGKMRFHFLLSPFSPLPPRQSGYKFLNFECPSDCSPRSNFERRWVFSFFTAFPPAASADWNNINTWDSRKKHFLCIAHVKLSSNGF